MAQLSNKVKKEGIMVLYQGALANALASFVGSYPWYFVFNALQERTPPQPPTPDTDTDTDPRRGFLRTPPGLEHGSLATSPARMSRTPPAGRAPPERRSRVPAAGRCGRRRASRWPRPASSG